MTTLREKAAELLKEKQFEQAIAVLNRLVAYSERRLHEGQEGGVDSWPYRSLASVYRKQGKYVLELETLERFVKNPAMPGSTHEAFHKEASMKIERHRRFGPAGKGECQLCRKTSVLERNELGEWLCAKCRKERQGEVRKRRWFQQLKEVGLSLPEHATEAQAWDALILHRDVARYVGDVWYHLTGVSYKSAVDIVNTASDDGITLRMETAAPLPSFDRFVSSLFTDYPLVLRLAAKERERTAVATEGLSEDQQSDPHKYLHVVAGKPNLVEDNDFSLVVAKLRQSYGQFITGSRS
ncbi:MAG: hypothetical protein ACRD2L_07070 [Terriglobia bacterium]